MFVATDGLDKLLMEMDMANLPSSEVVGPVTTSIDDKFQSIRSTFVVFIIQFKGLVWADNKFERDVYDNDASTIKYSTSLMAKFFYI